LVVALIALCFSCSPEVLAKIAVVGWFTSWFWRGDRIRFEEMFYGDWSYHNFSLVRHVWPTHDCAPRSYAGSLSRFEKRGLDSESIPTDSEPQGGRAALTRSSPLDIG